MGFDDLVDCSSFVSSAIGQMGVSVGQASHAIGELTKAVGAYSHVEGCNYAEESRGMRRNYGIIDTEIPPTTISSLFEKKSVKIDKIVKMSIVRKPLLKVDEIKSATLTVDNEKINWGVLEKNFGPFNQGDIIFHR